MVRIYEEVSPASIQRVVDRIVEQFRPQKGILFGSYAYGTPHEGSDVDLLVVMEIDENPVLAAARISVALGGLFPADVLVWDPRKLKAALERGANFATEVMTQGVLLYDAGN